MVISIIVFSSIFVALVMAACVMINRENSDGEENRTGNLYKNMCSEKNKDNKY